MYVISEWKSQSKTVGELKDRSIEIHILNTEEKIKKKKKKTASGTLKLPKYLTFVS